MVVVVLDFLKKCFPSFSLDYYFLFLILLVVVAGVVVFLLSLLFLLLLPLHACFASMSPNLFRLAFLFGLTKIRPFGDDASFCLGFCLVILPSDCLKITSRQGPLEYCFSDTDLCRLKVADLAAADDGRDKSSVEQLET